MMSVAIVQDHLVQRGGAERVLLSMSKALPGAPRGTQERTFADHKLVIAQVCD